MANQLIKCRDIKAPGGVEYIDESTGRVYSDEGGQRLLREMVPTEYVLGENGHPLKIGGSMVHVGQLANAAAEHYAMRVVEQTGRPCPFQLTDRSGERRQMIAKIECSDVGERVITMDLGVGDLHTPSTMPTYAAGYRISSGIADVVSPVRPVTKDSDVYFTWNASNDFNRKIGGVSAPGAAYPEISGLTTAAQYRVTQYVLSAFLPTEVAANADAPLQPFKKLTQMVTDGLMGMREDRVAGMMQLSGNWNSNLVQTVPTGAQWNNGPAADPIRFIKNAIHLSLMPVTDIAMSEIVFDDLIQAAAFQKFVGPKTGLRPLPTPQEVSAEFGLPPIHVATMKFTVGGAPSYVWGNHVSLFRQAASDATQMDVSTAGTVRWTGGMTTDGAYSGGFLVRTFFDPKRGPRGGTQVVAIHDDQDLMLSGLVGGLILNAHQ